LESRSEHPLARAIVEEAESNEREIPSSEDFSSITGEGVIGRVDGRHVRVGKAGFLQSAGLSLPKRFEEQEDLWQKEANTVVWLAADEEVLGLISIADPIKGTTRSAVQELHGRGIRVVMATGDHEATASAVGRELGIDEVHAGLSPEDKIALVRKLKSEGHVVAMAGDGINDAPALAEADVGIAMGTGTDVAIESAGITLVKGDLHGIANAITLGNKVMRNIRQNLLFAFGYNSLGVPLAAGVLFPFVGWLLSPMIAGAAMSFSSVSVIANSLRLRRLKL
jgi:Cu+-exporting ATPase